MHGGGTAMRPFYAPRSTEQDVAAQAYAQAQLEYALAAVDIGLRTHSGGARSGPFYMVYLTEQEVFDIIRSKLEAAGLNFGDTPPDNVYEVGLYGMSSTIGLDLFDAERGVAISHIDWRTNHTPFAASGGSRLAEETARFFNQQLRRIEVGVFFTPEKNLGYTTETFEWWGHEDVQRQIESSRERINELQALIRRGRLIGDTDEQFQERQIRRENAIRQHEENIMRYERFLSGEEFPSPEDKAELREVLLDELVEQVQTFIDFLQAEGIL